MRAKVSTTRVTLKCRNRLPSDSAAKFFAFEYVYTAAGPYLRLSCPRTIDQYKFKIYGEGPTPVPKLGFNAAHPSSRYELLIFC